MVKYLFSTSKDAAVPPLRADTIAAPGLPANAVEGAVEKGQNLPRGVRVVHGRAEHETVGRFRLFGELARRVVKDAFARFPALAAGDAILHGLCTRLENFRFDALFFQRFGDLAEGGIGAAVRAAVQANRPGAGTLQTADRVIPAPSPQFRRRTRYRTFRPLPPCDRIWSRRGTFRRSCRRIRGRI